VHRVVEVVPLQHQADHIVTAPDLRQGRLTLLPDLRAAQIELRTHLVAPQAPEAVLIHLVPEAVRAEAIQEAQEAAIVEAFREAQAVVPVGDHLEVVQDPQAEVAEAVDLVAQDKT